MSRPRHRIWLIFAVCSAALVGVLAWVSMELLDLEAAETRALAQARYQEDLRVALWRMDNKFSLLLAREAARPPNDYKPFPEVEGQVLYAKRDLQQIADDEVLACSPLLKDKPDFIRLHWEIDARGELTSPQVPQSVYRELAVPRFLQPEEIVANGAVLEQVRGLVDLQALSEQVEEAEAATRKWVNAQAEGKRAKIASQAKIAPQSAAGPDRGPLTLGPLEPIWQRDELLFVRRVQQGEEMAYQGFLADWPRLRVKLLAEIEDLFARADLRPLVAEQSDRQLFTLPAVLETPGPVVAGGRWTASHTVLAVTWAIVLGAGAVVAWVLRRSVAFGEQQRRFASLVTHELRSPLTTFRLYADLLAEGLVKEPDKRDLYHRTLQKESGHMARMVENVIAHARIEEGRVQLQRRNVMVSTLLDECAGSLRACTEKAGLELSVEAGGLDDVALETDPEAVAQILLNLVENACKYGRSDRRPAVLVSASLHDATLRLRVRDHGPGVPPDVARRIFRPFDRGARDERDPERGLGLGLALARGLAHDLGGDLRLESPTDGGACFVLSLPTAA